MAEKLKETLKTIEKYKASSPHYTELLDILEEILILREEYRRRLDKEVFVVDERLIASKMAGGLPLVDLGSGDADLTEPKRYFLALLAIAEKRAPEDAAEIVAAVREGTLDYEEMLLDAFSAEADETMVEETAAEAEGDDDDSFDIIELFLEESLRPALERVVRKYGDQVARSAWDEGYCPICGREPKIGQIRDEEGRRCLFCSQCGYEWTFRRIKCPFCGNDEQQSLAYFTIEDEERYRVDVCNVCKRYLKIVDFRQTQETPNLDVEDIATLHLDMLAAEEGYD